MILLQGDIFRTFYFILSLANIHSTQQDSDDGLRRGRGVWLMWNAECTEIKPKI